MQEKRRLLPLKVSETPLGKPGLKVYKPPLFFKDDARRYPV
jgi:hypothetical protein